MPRWHAVLTAFFLCSASAALAYDRAGEQAVLSTYAHGVSGIATILDDNTFEVSDFHYDGGGGLVYFYLAAEETYESFRYDGLAAGPDLVGNVYDGDTLTIDLPAGQTLDNFHALSVWCVAVNVSFGQGTFAAVPEPGSALLLVAGMTLLLLLRRPGALAGARNGA